jgi:hypothetical protein
VTLDPDTRVAVAADLALQRDVSKERIGGDVGWAKEEIPGNIRDPAAARTGDPGV